uniref:Uncharacterized protein n=1 Tax=Myoviridae sp. ctijX18 TaxID=2825154 RepID=A0A8S5USD3_9CAUD|nr:MAG TPA: hypothetical protein [Myoviridae sp. ctijX18]DAQ61103.1 MAG TPA: hypothetical protein [Caudoviricetes sp.]
MLLYPSKYDIFSILYYSLFYLFIYFILIYFRL